MMCHPSIKEALLASTDLQITQIDIDDKEVVIKMPEGIDEFKLQQRITTLLKSIDHTPLFSDELFQEQSSEQTAQHWLQGIIGCVSGLTLMMLCMFAGPLSLAWMLPIALASAALTLVLGAASYRRAFIEWTHGKQLSMDTLFAISTIIVLILSAVSFFVPALPMMLDTGLLIFGFRHLGLAIESLITQSMQINTRFVDRLPRSVMVLGDAVHEEKPLHEIKIGACIQVQPGCVIPLDGECLNADRMIYENIITGSHDPRKTQVGEKLLSGMRVAENSDPLLLRITQPLETSYLKRRDQQNAQMRFGNKAHFEIVAKQWVHYFIPAVLMLSVLSGAVLACFFPWTIAIHSAIAVLVSACPCTLGLVVPLAVKIGMKKASDHGIQFRNKDQLQRAGEVDHIVFDLNGTLTLGVPEVVGELVWDHEQISQEQCMLAIATLEQSSKHRYGLALYRYAAPKVSTIPDVKVQRHGAGMSASIEGSMYCIGNQQMMEENDVDYQTYDQKNHIVVAPCERIFYLVRSQCIVAHLVLRDPLRPDARQMMDALKSLGQTLWICTGDEFVTAQGYASQLDIPFEHIRARQRSALDKDDKSLFVTSLADQGYKVAMVGDDGNDVNALSASYFGLALRSERGDDVAAANAGAVIHGSSLLPVVHAFTVAQQTVSNIKQNLYMSLGYNIVTELLMGGFLVALGVVLNPSVGAALMIVQMCLILGNAYRFQQEPLLEASVLSPSEHGVGNEALKDKTVDGPKHAHIVDHGRDRVSALWTKPVTLNAPPLSLPPSHFLSHGASLL